jgi:predicted metal-dependent HD superfamily phosphohydrolase
MHLAAERVCNAAKPGRACYKQKTEGKTTIKKARPLWTDGRSMMTRNPTNAPDLHGQPRHLLRDRMLEDRFLQLWERSLLPGSDSDARAVWADLSARYAEPHRQYHDSGHLAHCLEQLDLAAGSIGEPDEVEMALWFHDVINEPARKDNEARSADYFRALAGGHIDATFIERVVGLILVTTHTEEPLDADQRFICDIDLSSFGCPWECFMRDSQAVKAEFPGSIDDYYRGKKAFLEQMLKRPRIFLTDFFNSRFEQQSRDNIRRLLALVEQRAD